MILFSRREMLDISVLNKNNVKDQFFLADSCTRSESQPVDSNDTADINK